MNRKGHPRFNDVQALPIQNVSDDEEQFVETQILTSDEEDEHVALNVVRSDGGFTY